MFPLHTWQITEDVSNSIYWALAGPSAQRHMANVSNLLINTLEQLSYSQSRDGIDLL